LSHDGDEACDGVGRKMLVVTGARAEVVAEFVVGSTEALR
jgi:hypothetical protein